MTDALTDLITRRHVHSVQVALEKSRAALETAGGWGRALAEALPGGARLLVAGNGGSAAQAQHLTAEIVGKYRNDRPPFSAVALHAETSALTAILNDYGGDEIYARQVRAHGRLGDVCVVMSTSGRSSNVLAAARAARDTGMTVWAMTGRGPNPLTDLADEAVCVEAAETATVQEVHLVAVHLICEHFDAALAAASAPAAAAEPIGARR
jgi:D-sedoheptulose 7-phosphate isomerase